MPQLRPVDLRLRSRLPRRRRLHGAGTRGARRGSVGRSAFRAAGRLGAGRAMIRVKIANQQEAVALDYAKLRDIGRVVLEGEGISEGRVSLAFVDNPTIHRLNK